MPDNSVKDYTPTREWYVTTPYSALPDQVLAYRLDVEGGALVFRTDPRNYYAVLGYGSGHWVSVVGGEREDGEKG